MTALLDARGWKALFKTDHGTFSEQLVCWVLEDAGPVGYVLSERTGRLRSAESVGNFDCYAREEEVDAVTVAAEPGWWIVERTSNEPDRAYWSKVLAWRIFMDGYGVKAIGVPAPDGSSVPLEADNERIQFVFDPEREPATDGPWPAPVLEFAA